ncbi:MAG: 4Fe-4S binding protein [Planctomycetota bacterium]
MLKDKSILPPDFFLLLDPASSLIAAIASRTVSAALLWTAGILLINAVVPRGFCSFICPLGSLIDIVDWFLGKRFRFRENIRQKQKPLAFVKYAILALLISAALFGTSYAGFTTAIPVIYRSLYFSAGRLELGFFKSWDAVRPLDASAWAGFAIFILILSTSILKRRFWCSYLCPTGALFSVAARLRLTKRNVNDRCVRCGKCVAVCDFDAIKPADFTTRNSDCSTCLDCKGVCPTRAIEFDSIFKQAPAGSEKNNRGNDAPDFVNPNDSVQVTRREFIIGAAAAAAGICAGSGSALALAGTKQTTSIRPPGALTESLFLSACSRCGSCLKICPGPVLHPSGFDAGFASLWTPRADFRYAGCHQDCNLCSQVCPTQAIRPLTIEEKRKTIMGLAVINTDTCLPYLGTEECSICHDTCAKAGYDAIHFQKRDLSSTISDEDREELESMYSEDEIEAMLTIQAPVVDANACIGCGQCENRCYSLNAVQHKKLNASAINIKPLET